MPQIELNNVCKSYDGGFRLDDVTLSIPDKSVTALVGPSGGGKSTLLKLINGLERPDRGVVRVFEAPLDYSRLPQLRRKIGYAVQGTGLFPHMTAWENITLLARIEKWPSSELDTRARHLSELVGLPPLLRDRYPFELSGGEQQRVGLCRAMMLNPPVFLLDEPFAAVDPITRADIHDELLRLQQSEPRTMVVVTHDLREAVKLATRLILVADGRIVADDDIRRIVQDPEPGFVADFIRSQLGSDSV